MSLVTSTPTRLAGSRKNLLHDFPGHVGQAKVAALVSIGQSLVIEAEKMQCGRMKVVHMDRILGNVPADFVGFPNDGSAADATASHPNAEGERMMVPTAHSSIERGPVLAEGGSPEF